MKTFKHMRGTLPSGWKWMVDALSDAVAEGGEFATSTDSHDERVSKDLDRIVAERPSREDAPWSFVALRDAAHVEEAFWIEFLTDRHIRASRAQVGRHVEGFELMTADERDRVVGLAWQSVRSCLPARRFDEIARVATGAGVRSRFWTAVSRRLLSEALAEGTLAA